MRSDAALSDDGVYRYWLERTWGEGREHLVWVMLNPSTADHREDDPTIRRCIGFSQAWGFDGLIVVNLFALRATNPRELATAADPIGPENDHWLDVAGAHAADQGAFVMAAWGANHAVAPRRKDALAALTRRHDVELRCLGTTQNGQPRHPLYVPASREPEEFS